MQKKEKHALLKDILFVLASMLCVLALFEGLILFLLLNPAHLARFPQGTLDRFKDIYNRFDRVIIQMEEDFAVYDKDLFYTLKPGRFTFSNREFSTPYFVNAMGLRDSEESLVHPEVIVLGDSFAMGWGVGQQESFAEVLEKDTGFKVLNAAISSYDTAREMRLLDRLDLSRVKYVVIQYCDNDFDANESFSRNGNMLIVSDQKKYEEAKRLYAQKKRYYFGRYATKFIWRMYRDVYEKVKKRDQPGFKPAVAEQARHFLNVLSKGTSRDLSRVQLIVLDADKNNAFLQELEKQAKNTQYAPHIRNLKTLDLSKRWNRNHFLALDDHLSVQGHALIATELGKIISRK
ncbi:MAG: hypothetical protein AB1540_16305 [Bdellovibrionota bacterium]